MPSLVDAVAVRLPARLDSSADGDLRHATKPAPGARAAHDLIK
jgi:hypothetical protein